MRYLRVVATVGVICVAFAAVVAIFVIHGPLQQTPLAWVFVAIGAFLTIAQAWRVGLVGQGPPSPSPYVVPRALPPSPPVVGREDYLHKIMDRVSARDGHPGIVVLHGEPGVGKTALAIDAARRLGQRYPDGALFAWLGGSATTESVLRVFVTSLQSQHDSMPRDLKALRERYTYLTKQLRRRLVVVLDDATDESLVQSLIPASDECAVIVTSRRELAIPHAAPALLVEPLGSADAMRILAGLVGQQRVEREPYAAEQIAASAQGSPLALNVAGASLAARPNWTLEATLDSAREQSTAAATSDSHLATALDLSFSLLTEQEKEALVSLGQLDDRAFEPWMLATLMRLPQERLAWRICDRLVHHGFLEHVVDDATGVATYRVLEHVMEYAKSRTSARKLDGAQLEKARRRLTDQRNERGRRDLSDLLIRDVYPELEQGHLSGALNNVLGALAQARKNLTRAAGAMKQAGLSDTDGGSSPDIKWFRQARDAEGLALAALAEVLAELGRLDQAMEMAQAAARTKAARPRALRCMGSVQRRQRRLAEAAETLGEALTLAKQLNLKSEQVRIWRETAILFAARGETGQGEKAIEMAMRVELDDESRRGLMTSLMWAKAAVLTAAYLKDRDREKAVEAANVLREAVAEATADQQLWTVWIGHQRAMLFRCLGVHEQSRNVAVRAAGDFSAMRHRYGAAICRFEQAKSFLDQDQALAALPILEDVRRSLAYCEDRWLEAQAVLTLGQVYLATGRVTDAAKDEVEAAAKLLSTLGDEAGAQQAQQLLARMLEFITARRRAGAALQPVPAVPGGFWTRAMPIAGGR